MVPHHSTSNPQATKVVIASGQFSGVTSFLEAVRLLSCLEGVVRVLADPLSGMVGIVFERTQINIQMIPTTLELFGFTPRVTLRANYGNPKLTANGVGAYPDSQLLI